MHRPGATRSVAAASAMFVAALLAGCGTSSKAPSATVQVPTTPVAAAPAGSVASQPTSADAGATTTADLAAVDAQLQSIDAQLGAADSGLAQQEGDPTQ